MTTLAFCRQRRKPVKWRAQQVGEAHQFVCAAHGGHGALREFAEIIIAAAGTPRHSARSDNVSVPADDDSGRADIDAARADDDSGHADVDSSHADDDPCRADDDSGRVDDDPARADVVRKVEGFIHGEEIEVGAGADDPPRGIR